MRLPDEAVNSPPLIARALQIEALQSALAAARGGHGRCVLLSGEAGVGKSRLLREFQEGVGASGVLVLQGNCFENDSALAYAPLMDALRRALSQRPAAQMADSLGHLAPELVKLLPELALTLPDVTPTPALAPELEKRRLFEKVVQFLSRLATPAPLVLIVEDIHWSDETSLEFLNVFARRLPSLPILLLLTTRPEAESPAHAHFLAQMNRERLAQEIRLQPLSPDAVDALLRSMFGWEQPVKQPFLNAIYTLTEGNPFFVEEVASALVTTGDIFYADGRWQHKPLTQLPIPRSLRLIVQQRTDHLSPAAADLLALAAVVGHNFDFELLAQLTAHAEATLMGLIKELVAARLVVEETADTFTFRHALTREAIYSGLLSRERRRWHQAIANFYEQQAETREAYLPQLAYHSYEAGLWDKALRYGQAAGIQAQHRFAPHAALTHFARAATAADQLKQPLSPDVQRQRGQVQQMIGNFEAALADFEATLNAARAAGDRHVEWQALFDLGYLWTSRDYTRAGEALEQTLALARTLDDPAALAHSLNRLGNWQANMGRPVEALRLHQEALTIFEGLQDKHGLAATLDLIGTASGLTGNTAESVAHYRRAIPLFEELGDRQGLASSLMMLATADFAAGEEAVRIAKEIGWRDGEARAHIGLAFGHIFIGSFDSALWHGRRGLEIAREIDHVYWQMLAGQGLGVILFYAFSLTEAEAYLTQVIQLARTSGAQMFGDTSLSMMVLTRLAQGNVVAAAELASTLALPPANQGSGRMGFVVWAQGEVALAEEQPGLALAIVETVFAAAPHMRDWQDIIRPILRNLQGRALAADDRADEALDALKDALEFCREHGMRSWQWRCHADLAHLYLQRKERPAAEAELTAAEQLITELAQAISDEARRQGFEQAARAYLPQLPELTRLQQGKQAFGGLTRREQEIAALIAKGKSNREIAAELFITVRTTKTHISSILTKLDLTSRTQIAVWALEKRLPE